MIERYETVGADLCVCPSIWITNQYTTAFKVKGQTHGSAPTGYKYNRKSLRLKHYDYAQAGYYFITIVAQNRAHLFGEIVEGDMVLNEAGKMVKKWHMKLEEKFQNICNHEMVIMPNHIHFIIEIKYEYQGQTHGFAPYAKQYFKSRRGGPVCPPKCE